MGSLIEQAKLVFDAYAWIHKTEAENRPQTPEEWQTLDKAYEKALAECNDPDEMRKVVDINQNTLALPVTLIIDTLSKLTELRRDPEELRIFAGYLRLYGSPYNKEWIILENQLEAEANELEK